MADTVVLDTSVIIKWVRQGEVRAAEALTWRQRFLAGEVTVAIPVLLAYEIANVLRYKDDLTTEQVKEAVQSLFDLGLDWIDLSVPMLLRSIELARVHDVAVYDAMFLALAEALGADLITADERLVVRVGALPYVRLLGQ